jgi:hypothetical protein
MTDRPGLREYLDTAPDYRMPAFEDGSSYGPGSPVYTAISQKYSRPIWNALSDDAKWAAITAAEKSGPESDPNPARSSRIDHMLTTLDQEHQCRKKEHQLPFHPRDVKGLFGGR